MDRETLIQMLARLSLFAIIGASVVATMLFIAIYGVMTDSDADWTDRAVTAVLTGGGQVIAAAIVLSKVLSNGGGDGYGGAGGDRSSGDDADPDPPAGPIA